MNQVEFDFVVKDSVAALELYKSIFEVEVIEATDYPRGTNEAVFSIFGTRFHMLDENPQYQLFAPKEEYPVTSWFNVTVSDIELTFEKAVNNGCFIIQPITRMEDFGLSNAMVKDSFGYIWMLHEIHRVVSFEERCKILENKKARGEA